MFHTVKTAQELKNPPETLRYMELVWGGFTLSVTVIPIRTLYFSHDQFHGLHLSVLLLLGQLWM